MGGLLHLLLWWLWFTSVCAQGVIGTLPITLRSWKTNQRPELGPAMTHKSSANHFVSEGTTLSTGTTTAPTYSPRVLLSRQSSGIKAPRPLSPCNGASRASTHIHKPTIQHRPILHNHRSCSLSMRPDQSCQMSEVQLVLSSRMCGVQRMPSYQN